MKSKVLTALLSVAIAFGMWLYVITYISQEIEVTFDNIPVVLQNERALESHGLMVTGGRNQTISLTLVGNRSNITRLTSTNISIFVDLSGIYDTGSQPVQYTISYPGDVPEGAIEVVGRSMEELVLTVEEFASKQIPVVPDYTGTVPDGYIADTEMVELSRQYVTVSGPAAVVDRVEQARVEVNLDGQTQTIDRDFDYILCDRRGEAVEIPDESLIRRDVSQIHLELTVLRVREIPLRVQVIGGGGADEESVTIVIDPAYIEVAGTDEALEGLDELVLGTIDLSRIPEDAVLYLDIELPEGVTDRTNSGQAAVTVTFHDLLTRTFTINQITPVNVPQGMIAQITTRQISLTVRGPEAVVRGMTTGDIIVTVDFSDVVMGGTTARPIVSFAAGFDSVGVLDVDNVNIRLLEDISGGAAGSGRS